VSKRHDSLGIKQVIRPEWMEKTVNLWLAGFPPKEIRQELDDYLSSRKQSGGIGARGAKTYPMAIGILMRSLVTPSAELVGFSNEVKLLLKESITEPERKALYWGSISAAYPFWFNVARQIGRLLNLQDQITKKQIIQRLKEQYGDRQTVSRVARYVIRSFVAWGVLHDTATKGCYEKGEIFAIDNMRTVGLLLEGALHTIPDGKSAINNLYDNPGFYMFDIPRMTGDFVAQANSRIEVMRFGLDDEILKLRE
jgi:hypothetical protein